MATEIKGITKDIRFGKDRFYIFPFIGKNREILYSETTKIEYRIAKTNAKGILIIYTANKKESVEFSYNQNEIFLSIIKKLKMVFNNIIIINLLTNETNEIPNAQHEYHDKKETQISLEKNNSDLRSDIISIFLLLFAIACIPLIKGTALYIYIASLIYLILFVFIPKIKLIIFSWKLKRINARLDSIERDIDNMLANSVSEEDLNDMLANTTLKDNNIFYDDMSGLEFENFCSKLLERNGFTNVEVTQGSGDHGIDILAEKEDITYAIQCKCYSSNIGNAAVQQAHTGKSLYHKDIAVVLTNRYFTQQAIGEARELGVKLWDRDKLDSMIEESMK